MPLTTPMIQRSILTIIGLTLMGLARVWAGGGAVFITESAPVALSDAGLIKVGVGTGTLANSNASRSGATFVLPGAPLAGFAGLPFVLSAGMLSVNSQPGPVVMVPPPLVTLSPAALAGNLLPPGGTGVLSVGGAPTISGLVLTPGATAGGSLVLSNATSGGVLRAGSPSGGIV
ncbi:MAG: hypothetical protein JWR77_2573, partial [Rhizorhabdus sp.]|nr:hypothetical protein [Rhizorhabdus sp.]